MSKVKYLIKCIKRLDYSNMFKIVKQVSKKSHKLRIIIFLDMVWCGLFYGAGYYDYQEFEFYLLSRKERKTYLTRVKNNEIVKKYNNKDYFEELDNKVTFNNRFKEYLKRDFLVIKNNQDEFEKFLKKYKEVIVKPIDGEGGHGVEKITYEKGIDIESIYKDLVKNNQLLVEECIKQHNDINKLYSKSVNTLRLFTFFDGKEAHVLNSVFKIGNGGITDNFSSGSMYTFVSDDGEVIVPAIDQADNIYEKHPITKENILGYKVPEYKKACNLVCKAAKEIKELKYIGWDVAISDKGPVIVEGNPFPGIFQIKPSFKRNMGLLPKYKKYMDIK